MKTPKHVAFLAFAGLTATLYGAIRDGGYGKPTDCRVEPLVQSMWGQTTATGFSDGKRCYNYYVTNQTDAAKDYVGCLPVAAGQIMRYWKCVCTNAPVSVDCVVSDGRTVSTNSLSTFGGPYAWDKMPDVTNDKDHPPADEQCQAIGKLIYDLVVASGSTFTPGVTFASPLSVRKCLLERVGGFASAEIVIFNDGNCPCSLDTLKKLVVPNLDLGAPVILALAYEGLEITHAIVVDGYGYDNDGRLMLHANIGAWGNCDGWYYADEGFRIEGHDYVRMSVCFFNLFPTNRGSVVSGRILDVSRRMVEGATVTVYSNETAVATCTTRANGSYAFVLPAGTYAIRTEQKSGSDIFSAELPQPLMVGATESRQVTEESGEWNYRSEPAYAPLIGNVIADDLMLPGLYSEQAAIPTMTPNGGTIAGATEVTLSCATPNAVIRYTLDGSDPTTQSSRYTVPFMITDGVTVKAVAFARNMNPSAMSTASFTYANKSKPVGDDCTAPMMLVGTNLTRTVDGYCKYTRAHDDPIVDKYIWDFTGGNPEYFTESHSAWFRWTAPGTGKVRLVGTLTGPSEWGYELDEYGNLKEELEELAPFYGICLVVYKDGNVSSENALARTQSGILDGYLACAIRADNEFEVKQGDSYLIQVDCPYDLIKDYSENYIAGPYYRQKDGYYRLFNSQNAYLDLSLTANLTITSPPPATMTVPDMPHATVRVLAGVTEVRTSPGKLSLTPNVNYAITYAADAGYAFADEKTTWTAIVRDDTGADFSVAALDGYPNEGPTVVGWRRPKTDSEVLIRSALATDGFTGAILSEVTSLAAFDAFVGYLDKKGVSSPVNLSDGQKANAYLCYRLGAESIPAETLTSEAVTITATEAQADGSLALELKIEGVVPGEEVSPQVIASVVSAEGGDDPSNLSKENVSLTGVGTASGKVRVTVSPDATRLGEHPAKFFTRLRVLP